MTVGQLKAAIAKAPDSMPVVVHLVDTADGGHGYIPPTTPVKEVQIDGEVMIVV